MVHCNDNRDKINTFVLMIQKLYKLVAGELEPDNLDSLCNLDVLLSGHLYGMFFREKLEEILDKLENYEGKKSQKENLEALCDQNVNIQIKLKEILNEFWKSFKPLKCPNCDSSTIKLKKQGFIKIFQMP